MSVAVIRASFKSVIAGYLASPDFAGLRDRTKADYLKHMLRSNAPSAISRLLALMIPKSPGVSSLARRHGVECAASDYAWTVLMLLLAWARSRGITLSSARSHQESLPRRPFRQNLGEPPHCSLYVGRARACLQWALVLAAETGQRQGDLFEAHLSQRLTGNGFTPQTQSKKPGRKVRVPVIKRLRAMLGTIACARRPTMLTNSRDHPWAPNAFRKAWAAAAPQRLGIVGSALP